MTLEVGLRSFLSSQSLLFGVNVFIDQAPGPSELAASVPYCVIQMVSKSPIHTHPTTVYPTPSDTGIPTYRDETFQVSVFADNPLDALTMREAVLLLLDGFRGAWEVITVGACLFSDWYISYDQDTRTFGWVLEFQALYK